MTSHSHLDPLRESLPEQARDLKVNLQNVLQESSLTPEQRWGVAVACGLASRNPRLAQVLLDQARESVGAGVIDDARAAAALMAMNNVYYRSKHMLAAEYQSLPARLRMTRIAKPATNKLDFELMCLAVSAINGCERCILAHERTVRDGGMTAEHVHDAIRIAATVQGVAVGLELGV
ncbi:MAG: carboxymuconolactone decarboxylase family protein [Nannocystis sp.]|nr:carboxymuconolactone decarboxylase family protein [Nannocystis sp.]MBA3549450.1 carboxymuconolactone decarboxylase family protein [Nannocystis sp.]